MANPNDPTLPHLMPGPGKGQAWKVLAVPQGDASVAVPIREMRVPRYVIPTDALVQMHEYEHIHMDDCSTPRWKIGHHFRDQVRKMVSEVAVDVRLLRKGLVDPRWARDDLDWTTSITPPWDENGAVLWYLQIGYSAPHSRNADLRSFFQTSVLPLLSAGTKAMLDEAIAAIEKHPDAASCDEIADWITSRLVPTEDAPESPTSVADEGEQADEDASDEGEGEEDEDQGDGTEGDEDGEGDPAEGDAEGDDEGDSTGDGEGDDSDDAGEGSPGGAGEPAEGEEEGDEGDEGQDGKPGGTPRTEPRFLADPYVPEPRLPTRPEPGMGDARGEILREEAQREAQSEKANRAMGAGSHSVDLTYTTDFGKVDVHRHTLDRTATGQATVTWRPSAGGSHVRYPHRLYPTGRVFGVREKGGSMLIDGSGSMAWTREALAAAMEKLPRLWAGIYSMHRDHWTAMVQRVQRMGPQRAREVIGQPFPFLDGNVSKLCVVANEGRLADLPKADTCPEHTGENGDADKASLAYLIKHTPAPWVWVSDGHVEAATSGNWPAVDMLMRRHRVVRVTTIEAAVDYLTGKAVQGFTECSNRRPQTLRLGGAFVQESRSPREW